MVWLSNTRVAFAAGVSLLAALGPLWTFVQDTPRPCPQPTHADPATHPECFFSDSYFAARSKFRYHAEQAGATLHVLPLPRPSLLQQDLTIDVAVLPGSSKKLVLHISGTHGTEGFVGSAVQSAWLSTCPRVRASSTEGTGKGAGEEQQPTVMLVHALNPYGMAHWRRWNEDNIDLNRNCLLTTADWDEVLQRDPDHAGYESTVHPLCNREAAPSAVGRIEQIFRAAWVIGSGQALAMKKALVSATYAREKGLFYGGKELAASHRVMAEFLQTEQQKLLSSVRELTILDVHSGLGPMGRDTLLLASTALSTKGAQLALAQKVFGVGVPPPYGIQDVHGGGVGAAEGYDLVRGVTLTCYAALFTALDADRTLLIAQEFGTYSGPLVLRAMVEENMAWHYGGAVDLLPYSTAMRDTFAPRRQSFFAAAMARGLLVAEQATAHHAALAAAAPADPAAMASSATPTETVA